MSEPDYDGYEKSLEKVLEGATKDYYSAYVDINRHQVTVGRAYLWVSAALIGVYATAFEKFGYFITSHSCSLVISAFAFILACVGFGICLYSIPARKGYMAIPQKGWGEFSKLAYNELSKPDSKVYGTFLTHLISRVDQAYAYNFKTNQKRAQLLRVTSWILISSFSLAIFASAVTIVDSVYSSQPKDVNNMSDDNQSSNTNQPSQQPEPAPQLKVPEPPPSADIGTGGIISTHSAEPIDSTNVVVATEGLKPNK